MVLTSIHGLVTVVNSKQVRQYKGLQTS
jgi:hypothetical protein